MPGLTVVAYVTMLQAWGGAQPSVNWCELRMRPVVALGDEHTGMIGRPLSVTRDRRGRYFVVSAEVQTAVQVFDSAGGYYRTLGRRGNGPGEFRAIHLVHHWRGDSIAVWDWANRRVQVYPPSLEQPRIQRMDAPGRRAIVLGDGRMILNGHVPGPNAPYTLHIVDTGGVVRSSFDDSPGYTPGSMHLGQRAISIAKEGFWSAPQTGIHLSRWSTEGKLISQIRRSVAWLSPGQQYGPQPHRLDRPPGAGLIDIAVDDGERIWTLFHVPDRTWAAGLSPRENWTSAARRIVSDENKYYDTIVDVMNQDGLPVGQARFDMAVLGWLGPGIAYSYSEDKNAFPRIQIWGFDLIC